MVEKGAVKKRILCGNPQNVPCTQREPRTIFFVPQENMWVGKDVFKHQPLSLLKENETEAVQTTVI